MKTRLAALVAAVVVASTVAYGVAGPDDDPEPGPVVAVDDGTGFVRNKPLTDPPSESYALREIHTNIAHDIYGLFVTMATPMVANPNAINDGLPNNPGQCSPNPYSWQKNRFKVGFGSAKYCGSVEFSDTRYTDDTDLKYGTPRIVEGPLGNLPGSESDRRLDNRNGLQTGAEIEIEQAFEIDQSVESKSASEFSVDVTVEETSKVTVGGEETGGSFEQELKTTFGSHFGQSEEQTTAESTAQTDSLKAAFTVEDGQDILATFSNKPITTHVDYSVNGYYDFGIQITMNNAPNWWWNNTRYNGGRWGSEISDQDWNLGSRYNYFNRCFATNDNPGWRNRGVYNDNAVLKFSSLADYLDMYRGTNVDWPRLADPDCSIEAGKAGYHGMWPGIEGWLDLTEDKARRKIVLKGTQERDSQTAVRLTFYDLGGCSEADADAAEDNAEDPNKTAAQVLVGANGQSLADCSKTAATHDAVRTPKTTPTPPPTTTTTAPPSGEFFADPDAGPPDPCAAVCHTASEACTVCEQTQEILRELEKEHEQESGGVAP